MFFSKKQNLESIEYTRLLGRIGELNADLEILKSRLNSQDTKLDELKVLLAKIRRETNKIKEDEEGEGTEKVINDDGFSFFR